LSILNAPPAISCLRTSPSDPSVVLGVRVSGDWSKALNSYARAETERVASSEVEREREKEGAFEDLGPDGVYRADRSGGVPVQVMLDGPYGGCGLDLGAYDSVLLLAGGSGASFTLGLLDDLVGRCVGGRRGRGERTRKVEFAWCVRGFGRFLFSLVSAVGSSDAAAAVFTGSIGWFAPYLMDISNAAAAPGSALDLHVSIFVTCLCDPEAVPEIPNSTVTMFRPCVRALLDDLVGGATLGGGGPDEVRSAREDAKEDAEFGGGAGPVRLGGGVAVCASGPESLTRAAANAVARLSVRRGVELGGIALHTEVFRM
jgi:hypothetical protein